MADNIAFMGLVEFRISGGTLGLAPRNLARAILPFS
jgi:hypothetical protein